VIPRKERAVMTMTCIRCAALVAALVVPSTLAHAQAPPANASLVARVTALESAVASLRATVEAQQGRIVALEAALAGSAAMGLNPYLEVTTHRDLPLIRFKGANVQIVNGVGPLQGNGEGPGSPMEPISNGRGNLILGYDEDADDIGYGPSVRGGSHNLVVGPYHSYDGFAGIVAGFQNQALGIYATITGGYDNTARGSASSVSGGTYNHAVGELASISGGFGGFADGNTASVGGGHHNRAAGDLSTVSGGDGVTTVAHRSWAAGAYRWEPPEPTLACGESGSSLPPCPSGLICAYPEGGCSPLEPYCLGECRVPPKEQPQ
jgi:hypothetical protein